MEEKAPVVLGVCRFVYGGFEHHAVGGWLARSCAWAVTSGKVAGLHEWVMDRAPLPCARNAAAEVAKGKGCTHVVFVDNDMQPDCVPGAPPFLPTALAFALRQDAPCVVAAPACTRLGQVCVYALNEAGDAMTLMAPGDAAGRSGFEAVPATGLSLALIDLRCFDLLSPPYFYFVYADELQTEMWGSEDLVFTDNLRRAGGGVFAAWDSWQGHHKLGMVGKPGG